MKKHIKATAKFSLSAEGVLQKQNSQQKCTLRSSVDELCGPVGFERVIEAVLPVPAHAAHAAQPQQKKDHTGKVCQLNQKVCPANDTEIEYKGEWDQHKAANLAGDKVAVELGNILLA